MKLWFNPVFDEKFSTIFAKCKLVNNYNALTRYLCEHFDIIGRGSLVDDGYYYFKYNDKFTFKFNIKTFHISQLLVKNEDDRTTSHISKSTLKEIEDDVYLGLTKEYKNNSYRFLVTRMLGRYSNDTSVTGIFVVDSNGVLLDMFLFKYEDGISMDNGGLLVKSKDKLFFLDFESLECSEI